MKMARFSMSDYLARSLASVAFNTRLQRPEVTSPGDFFLFHERLHLRLGTIPKIMRLAEGDSGPGLERVRVVA